MNKNKVYNFLIVALLLASSIVIFFKFFYIKNSFDSELLSIHNKTQKEWRGQNLIYPEDLIGINTDYSIKKIINNDSQLIVNYLDGDCSVCFDDLKKWREYLDKKNKTVLFIVSGSEKIKIDYMINDVLNFEYPIFYDEYDSFSQLNNISEYRAYHSFLLRKDKVIRVGSPILLKGIIDLN